MKVYSVSPILCGIPVLMSTSDRSSLSHCSSRCLLTSPDDWHAKSPSPVEDGSMTCWQVSLMCLWVAQTRQIHADGQLMTSHQFSLHMVCTWYSEHDCHPRTNFFSFLHLTEGRLNTKMICIVSSGKKWYYKACQPVCTYKQSISNGSFRKKEHLLLFLCILTFIWLIFGQHRGLVARRFLFQGLSVWSLHVSLRGFLQLSPTVQRHAW